MRRAPAVSAFAADTPPARPKVVVFTEHFNATYFISFDQPLRRLHSSGKASFRAFSQEDVARAGVAAARSWIDGFEPDAVVFTRYGQADGIELVQHCRSRGIPVVYHIDDDLLELPASLGAEIVKRQGAAVAARKAMLQASDLVYASTRELARLLSTRFPQCAVFHGMYAAIQPISAVPAPPEPTTIGYMGSKGHKEDLELVVPALVELLHERPELRFETFGTIEVPAALRSFGDRVAHHSVMKSYSAFLQALAGLGWTVGLAPLVDEPFNRCKAPTKFIEYTSCAIPTVASDIPVYAEAIPEGAGVLVRDADWGMALRGVLDNPGRRAAIASAARDHCEAVFSPGRLDQQVLDVLARAGGGRLAH